MTKQSIKAAVRQAKTEDKVARKDKGDLHTGAGIGGATLDSFVNFAHKLGVGADNPLTSGTYGYNPITRNRQLLEFMYRGSWIAGVAIDVVAADMTRAGIDLLCEMDPRDIDKLNKAVQTMGAWEALKENVSWGRLYGGSVAVMLVDGQDPKTPLRLETVGRNQFKGVLTLDRWMVESDLSDLVQDYGPHLGLPKYYKVMANAPALRGQAIHYSRIAQRHVGVQLPYQQRLTENLWGISVLERLYDRMIAFDSASTGAAQLVFKAHLRTLKIPGLRDIIAAGNAPMSGLIAYTEVMRRFQGIEGLTLLDGEDEFDVQGAGSGTMSGVDAVVSQLGQQLSGALQVPMTRLFGQAPGGLSTDDESGLRTYYDKIKQEQRSGMGPGCDTIFRLAAASEGIPLPPDFAIDFSSLWEMSDTEKQTNAKTNMETVGAAKDKGFISDKTALLELRQSSRYTGVFTNITQADIDAADDQVTPPVSDLDLAKLKLGVEDDEPAEGDKSLPTDVDPVKKPKPVRKKIDDAG
jgi:phage-related protein (TIGR01555 family)